MDKVEEVLAHYGVKGMKWGVRKDRSASVTVAAKGKRLKTSGGVHAPPHPDAVTAAGLRQKAKKSGSHALSNAELKMLNERLNMETQYARLTGQNGKSVTAKGAKFAGEIVAGVAKQQITKVANDYASQQVAQMLAAKKK